MNKEVIKTHERDLRLFCSLAADSLIAANIASADGEVAISMSAHHAFKLAATQMYFHLEQLKPERYPYISLCLRDSVIRSMIEKLIKERSLNVKKTQPLS